MPYTTFPNERVLLKYRNEVLVLTDRTLSHGTQFVAVSRNGHTDYPIYTGTGVLWDFPELFSQRFRIRATLKIARIKSSSS
jgi:hypothetical protein